MLYYYRELNQKTGFDWLKFVLFGPVRKPHEAAGC